MNCTGGRAMTRHARTVILLGGWLLMTPPWKEGVRVPESQAAPNEAPSARLTPRQRRLLDEGSKPAEPDTSAPITKWKQVAAFDAAKDCETERAKHLPKGKVFDAQRLAEPGWVPILPAGVPILRLLRRVRP